MTDELVKVDDGEPVPLWALDIAANRSGWDCWATVTVRHEFVLDAIIAHARTIAKHETPPVDPAEEQRWKDAREAAAQYCEAVRYDRGAREARDGHRDTDDDVRTAYIALCNRDGVTPNFGEKK